jgi:leucyl aminopeptidase
VAAHRVELMRTSFTTTRSVPAKTAAVLIPVPSSGSVPAEVGHTRAQLSALGFEGVAGQTYVMASTGKGPVKVLLGVGPLAGLNANTLRTVAAAGARACSRYESVATTLATVARGNAKNNSQAVVEGMALALHRYVALKNDKGSLPKLTSVALVAPAGSADVRIGMERGVATSTAVCTARDFANTPPSHLTARQFADHAMEIARKSGLKATVYNKDQLKAMGCGGIIGVNAGSTEPPRMVKLEYRPTGASGHVVLVGKGVMYDSGGISLKPSDPMHAMMKMDMSGAAAVLATMGSLRALKVKTKVTAFMMCTDNMPSGSALKLGDVLTMRNGKTVEIHNTDAEGRLILADGLSLGTELKPDAMVDIATLTGACLGALGKKMAGVMSNNSGIVSQLMDSSGRTDELLWELPLFRDYRSLLDSNVADMRNIGGPYAGATTAALFLNEFVGDVPWAHLDIAGPMDSDGDSGWLNRGATAYGTRLLIDFVSNFKKTRAKNS